MKLVLFWNFFVKIQHSPSNWRIYMYHFQLAYNLFCRSLDKKKENKISINQIGYVYMLQNGNCGHIYSWFFTLSLKLGCVDFQFQPTVIRQACSELANSRCREERQSRKDIRNFYVIQPERCLLHDCFSGCRVTVSNYSFCHTPSIMFLPLLITRGAYICIKCEDIKMLQQRTNSSYHLYKIESEILITRDMARPR